MPFAEDVRVPLIRLLTALRRDWNDQEVGEATRTLKAQDADPFTLVDQALRQAAKGNNERAISITWPLSKEALVRALPARRPEQRECPEHGGTITDDQGRFSCCRFPDAEPLPPFQRPPSVPPAGVRELVVEALEASRKERQAKEQQG